MQGVRACAHLRSALDRRKQAAYFPALVVLATSVRSLSAVMGKASVLPRLGSFRRISRAAFIGAATLSIYVAAPQAGRAIWPWSTAEAPVGSPQWWKSHQADAVFTPHMGFQVEGVDGYFDGSGRPIQGPVSEERVVEASQMKDETGLIPQLDPRVQYNKVKAAVGLGPNEQIARQDYAEGDRLFHEKNYSAAATAFKAAIGRGPHSSIEQDAMFMLAECYFFDDRYVKARDSYDALVKEYTNTRYLDTVIDREWKIARYWEQCEQYRRDWPLTPNGWDKTRPWFDTIGHAIKTYENIRLNDPTGPGG